MIITDYNLYIFLQNYLQKHLQNLQHFCVAHGLLAINRIKLLPTSTPSAFAQNPLPSLPYVYPYAHPHVC